MNFFFVQTHQVLAGTK